MKLRRISEAEKASKKLERCWCRWHAILNLSQKKLEKVLQWPFWVKT